MTATPEYEFLRDDGVFDASLDEVWGYLAASEAHQRAHGHRSVRREILGEHAGVYTWEQPFYGAPARFTMRWTAFPPAGIAYEVLEGPFAGSRFFLIYHPDGARTAVSVVGAFRSPSLPASEVRPAALAFFATEFDQDSDGLAARRAASAPGDRAR